MTSAWMWVVVWVGVLLVFIAFVLGAVVLVFFPRECAGVIRGYRLGPVRHQFSCQRCGRCCRLTVLTTQQTVRAMAEHSGRPPDAFSKPLLWHWAVLKKGADGACVLRERTGSAETGGYRCTVHPVRPRACRRFPHIYVFGKPLGIDNRCPHIPRP